jgi:hypothetical protein
VRNQDKDYAGHPQAHRASLRNVALTKHASRDVFLKFQIRSIGFQIRSIGFQIRSQIWQGVFRSMFFLKVNM